jgi:hypothetical protein
MSSLNWLTTARELDVWLRNGDIAYCVEQVSKIIQARTQTPFHDVLDLKFANDTEAIATHFDLFFGNAKQVETPIAAIYTEMNEFDINPDRWYFTLFAYPKYGGTENYDWLAYFEETYPFNITLLGMEKIQEHHKTYLELSHKRDPNTPQDHNLEEVRGYCDLLVVLRFQEMIQQSVGYMKSVNVPILATGHDYDFIYQVIPSYSSL